VKASRSSFPCRLLSAICLACDPVSTLHGIVQTPIEGCPTRASQAVVDAEVHLTCQYLQERSAEPNPSRSDEKGAFEFNMASFDSFSQNCRVRITKEGYQPFEASLAELNYRVGPEVRTVHVEISLRRGSSP
jgi:hypothetical protein